MSRGSGREYMINSRRKNTPGTKYFNTGHFPNIHGGYELELLSRRRLEDSYPWVTCYQCHRALRSSALLNALCIFIILSLRCKNQAQYSMKRYRFPCFFPNLVVHDATLQEVLGCYIYNAAGSSCYTLRKQ